MINKALKATVPFTSLRSEIHEEMQEENYGFSWPADKQNVRWKFASK